MAIEPSFQVRLGIYRIDDEILALRQEIWNLLAPTLDAITQMHLANVVKCAPFYKDLAEKAGTVHAQTIRKFTEKLLLNPLDELWVNDAYERARMEVQLGYDMRSRSAISSSILVSFKELVVSRHRFSVRKAVTLTDAAVRLLMLDSANAVFCHHALDVQKTKKITADLTNVIRSFASKIDNVKAEVGNAIGALGKSSDELAKMAADASDQTKAAGLAAQDTALRISTIAEATEQLSDAIEAVQARTVDSAQIALAAVSHSEKSNTSIRSLSDAVTRIGSVVETISAIAAQTNMLALNATIEAARAGEAGRGFAVVANEVKSLAIQTTKATQDVGGQITTIENAMRISMNEIEQTGRTIAKISNATETVVQTIGQQSNATNEIAANATGASANAGIVAEALQAVEATVLKALGGTKEVLTLADGLARQSSELNAATTELFDAAAKITEANELAELARVGR